MSNALDDDLGNVAVVVAHPGHELMVHHFMERHRPRYFCLTEGSGGNAESRLTSTGRLLQAVGSTPGGIYGRFTDREGYRLLLDGRVEVFVGLKNELAEELMAADVAFVAGDAMEGFNPMHDICRGLIAGAVAAIRKETGRSLQNYEIALHEPYAPANESHGATRQLPLDDAALERKLAAAHAYPEMRGEVEAALERLGREGFARERLQQDSTREMLKEFETTLPWYEGYGQRRVSEGRYQEVIRYREHVFPVLVAMGAGVV